MEVNMLRIDEDGNVFINGKNIHEILKNNNSRTFKRNIVIENGKIIKNDVVGEPFDINMEDFHNDFLDFHANQMKNVIKVKCDYCNTLYDSSSFECPNCGAANDGD